MLKALERSGWSLAELARKSGVSYDVLNKLKRREGSSTTVENSERIADALREYLDEAPGGGRWSRLHELRLRQNDEEQVPPEGQVLVPLYDVDVSAGPGLVPADGATTAYSLVLPVEYLAAITDVDPAHLRVFPVHGMSMYPTLKHRDLAVANLRRTSLAYDGVFIIELDGAVMVKRIGRSKLRDHVQIISDNAQWHPVDRHRDEVRVLGELAGKIMWE